MKIELIEDKLVTKLSLLEGLEAFKRKLEIPVPSIVDVKPFKDTGVKLEQRVEGSWLSNKVYGTFITSKGKAFIATQDIGKATVLFLKDFKYDLAILDLDGKIIEELEKRISSRRDF